MKVTVAITGPLSTFRQEASQRIESKTNASYVKRVTHQTTYLVASRMDTRKAKRAILFGIPILSESDMKEFIRRGEFPEQAQMTIWNSSNEI